MKEFIEKDFLLETDTAKELFETIKKAPIFDRSSLITTSDIAKNRHFSNVTELLLLNSPEKWKAMRNYGIEEYYITGDSTDYEKFKKWAEVVPYLIGSPLYHKTHLELQRLFDIYEPLSPSSMNNIWEKANNIIQSEDFCAFGILKKFNVECIFTADDPTDSLEYHIATAQNPQCKTIVLPSFEPDKVTNIQNSDFKDYIIKLSITCNKVINTFSDLKDALEERLLFFKSVGTRMATHTFEKMFFEEYTDEEIEVIFKKALNEENLSTVETDKYKTALTVFLSNKYADYGFSMNIATNIVKNTNLRMSELLGNMGFESYVDIPLATKITALMNKMAENNSVPKIIFSSNNLSDIYTLGNIIENFQGGGIKGKIQLSLNCDKNENISAYLKILGNFGILSTSIGISSNLGNFVSFVNQEYFRRILCNTIGNWVENGEYPRYMNLLKKIVEDISFNNAKEYFEI